MKELNVIDLFLQNWKNEAEIYYNNLLDEYLVSYNNKEWLKNHSKNEIAIMYKITCYGHDEIEKAHELLNILLDKEVISKKKTLISTIEKKAGKIVNADNLEIGIDGNINGTIQGELKTVKIETILAGGYNIQCLHYRVLVK